MYQPVYTKHGWRNHGAHSRLNQLSFLSEFTLKSACNKVRSISSEFCRNLPFISSRNLSSPNYTYFSIPKITAALYFVNLAGDGCICNSSCSIVRVYSRFPRQLQCSCYLENLGGGVWEYEWLIHPDSLVCDRLTGMSQACLECHEAIHNFLFHHPHIASYFCQAMWYD